MNAKIKMQTIYEFSDYRSFLSSFIGFKKNEKNSFSIRRWSKQLDIKSPATLNMFLNGHRHPGPELVEKISEYFTFSENETNYFRNLIDLAKKEEKGLDATLIIRKLESNSPRKNFKPIDFRKFNVMSNWFYLAIRELVSLEGFVESATWIKKRLRFDLSRLEIRSAINDMIKIGVLQRNGVERLELKGQIVESSNDICNSAVTEYHRQVMSLATQGLEKIPIHERQYSAAVLNVAKKDLAQAKKELHEFAANFISKYQAELGDETYQLNLQFFPLTKK